MKKILCSGIMVLSCMVTGWFANADDDIDRAKAWLEKNKSARQEQAAVIVLPQAQGELGARQDGDMDEAADWLQRQQEQGSSVELAGKNGQPKDRKSYAANDQFDLFMNAGGWHSSGNPKVNAGQYAQGKARYRLLSYSLFGQPAGLGGFVLGETGSGRSGSSPFSWNKVAVGPSHKIYGKGWDDSTDLGWARQWDKSKNDKQTTDSIYLSNYTNLEQRRRDGKKWFPQTEVILSANIPYDADKTSVRSGKSLPADNKFTAGLDVRQSIYDFDFENRQRLTPGLLLGGGLEAKDGVGKIGPSVKWGAFGQDILIADVFSKFKSGVQGYRWYGALLLNVGGAIKAYKASQITEPGPEDLGFYSEK
ncbi:MAG: hypothetical protein Q7R92_03300 [bacterium]|nr:hypothetical protein [bacterium]